MKISSKREWIPPGLCSWTLRHRLYSVSNLTCINIDSHRCPKQFSKIVLISQSIYSTSVSARSVDIYNWGIRSDLENSIIPWLCKLLGLNRVRSKYQVFPYRGDGGVLLLAENGSTHNKPKIWSFLNQRRLVWPNFCVYIIIKMAALLVLPVNNRYI